MPFRTVQTLEDGQLPKYKGYHIFGMSAVRGTTGYTPTRAASHPKPHPLDPTFGVGSLKNHFLALFRSVWSQG